jgi:hypothetical protein
MLVMRGVRITVLNNVWAIPSPRDEFLTQHSERKSKLNSIQKNLNSLDKSYSQEYDQCFLSCQKKNWN